jgi:hypothetical protein
MKGKIEKKNQINKRIKKKHKQRKLISNELSDDGKKI